MPFLITDLMMIYNFTDKSDLLELAQGLHDVGVRLLRSGGTAKNVREAGIPIQFLYLFYISG